jgi:very-short-patch-repair endonuclease
LKLLVVDAGFPTPTEQFAVVDVLGCIRYVLDLCWPELRIALEYDGYEAHEYRLEEDAQRDLDLERRGWITIRASAADLRDPGELISRLDDAFRVRGAGHYRAAPGEQRPCRPSA